MTGVLEKSLKHRHTGRGDLVTTLREGGQPSASQAQSPRNKINPADTFDLELAASRSVRE